MSVECGFFILSRNRHRLGVSHPTGRLSIPEPATLVPVPDMKAMSMGKAMPEPETESDRTMAIIAGAVALH